MSNFLINEDTDLLAAEFVLGTLDSEERAGAQSLLKTDHGFIAMVRIWERRFGELHLMVEPVDPDAKLWQRIKTKVGELAPREGAPESPAPASPAPASQAPASPKPPEAAATAAAPETPETPQPAEGEAAPKPPDAPANGAALEPAEISAAAETAKLAEAPPTLPPAPDLIVPPAAETKLSPEARALEAVVRSVGLKVAITPPPPLTPAGLQLLDMAPDKLQARAVDRPREVTIDVIRSRSRWRVFGMCMMALVAGLAALLAAWKFVPDRLPAGLRPAELMMSIGIESIPRSAPGLKPAPPGSEFDE
ncbi:MAG TPA: hypothetical protein VIY51_14000 [Xanthobacteraceae bacterium]